MIAPQNMPVVSLMLPAKVKLSTNGLTITDMLPFEDWQRCLAILQRCQGAVQWWIGDALNAGERAYGEKYSQAVSEQQAATWTSYAWVARKVAISSRKEALSYKHHEVVAKLEPADQERWLDKAIAEQWTVREFRAAVRGVHPADEWTLDEAVKVMREKLDWLFERWPADKVDVLSAELCKFADGLLSPVVDV